MLKSVDETFETIRCSASFSEPVSVTPYEGRGMVLGADVVMESDSPPFDRALLDGYAVISDDATPASRLEIVGRQDAGGEVWRGQVQRGQCVGINTGAPMPGGADAVLMVEHSEIAQGEGAGGAEVIVKKEVGAGFGVQRRGAQGRKGEAALKAGTVMTPAAVGAAVAAGAREVRVIPRPRVAVLTTGDELVEAGKELDVGQIRNSNSPMLMALLDGVAGVVDLGHSRDEAGVLRGKLEAGLEGADVLVVTGGMSMGTKDLVLGMLKELGVEILVEKVRMKPGKPFLFGRREKGERRSYVCGLPGNPVSAFVTFHLFVKELLGVLSGRGGGERFVAARAGSVFAANGEREFFQPCVLRREGEHLVAVAGAWPGSADVFALARLGGEGGLVRRGVNAPAVGVGEVVRVLVV
ncbi:MAG: molybdopterin molybdotransferase MoeA [Phycisphaerae bacterium]